MKAETIILGGGCFWCLEAVFQRVKGINSIINGYSGGEVENPSYEQVSSGATGHAEVVKLVFDLEQISLEKILEIFWTMHNPTTRNRQGNDVGTQYRSIILYSSPQQKASIEKSLAQVAQPLWPDPIVTEVAPLVSFYRAERYHQNYFNQHPEQAYCQIVINPKVSKLKEKHADIIKDY